MKTKLKSVRFRAVRSFAKEFSVDFPDAGMVLVRGRNLDTGGSSGSGKSSFLMALAYALDYSPFPGSALQSWLTDDKMFVEVTMDTQEGEAVLRRGEKSHLTFANGTKVSGSAKAIAEKTEQIIGLKPEMLAALTYRAQKKPGLFINKTDSEKKEFLSDLLGLGRFEEAVEKAQENAKKIAVDFHVEKGTLELRKTEAEATQQKLDLLRQKPLTDMGALAGLMSTAQQKVKSLSEELNGLKSELQTKKTSADASVQAETARLQVQLDQIKASAESIKLKKPSVPEVETEEMNKLKGLLEQCEVHIQSAKEKDQKARDQLKEDTNNIRKEISIMTERVSALSNLVAQKPDVEFKLKKLAEQICPTCAQNWENSSVEFDNLSLKMHQIKQAEPELAFKKQEILAMQNRLDELESSYQPSGKVEKLLAVKNKLTLDLQAEKNKIDNSKQELLNAWKMEVMGAELKYAEEQKRVNSEIQALRDSLTSEYASVNQKYLDVSQAIAKAHAEEKDASARHMQAKFENEKVLEEIKQQEQKLGETHEAMGLIESKIQELEARRLAELDFVELCGREGFLGNIFDEILLEISEETNRIMAMVPNVAHLSLSFKSEAITQKGTVKKTIVPVIMANGREVPFQSGCSGGMQTSVELAVDLAVAEVVSRRTGAVPHWLILDECFEGLGTVEKEGCLEILQGYAKDRLVLVIDHASEFKEMFSKFIEIEHSNGESFLT